MPKTYDFEAAVVLARTLPQDKKELAAEFIERLAATTGGLYQLSRDERAAVAEGVAQADRSEFVSDEEMDAFFDSKTV